MRKSLFFAAAFLTVSVSGFGQIRVDSKSNTYIGDEAEEYYEKLCQGLVTIVNDNAGKSGLNMYHTSWGVMPSGDPTAPYFMQCVLGNTNEIVSSSGQIPLNAKLFQRVFYVNTDGEVFSRDGMIQEAVEPSDGFPSVWPSTQSADNDASAAVSALSRLSGISGVSYEKETVAAGEAGADVAVPMSGRTDGNTTRRLGLMADQVEAAVPEAVRTLDDGTKGIYYSDLVVVLIDAVNELSAELAEVKAQLAGAVKPGTAVSYAPGETASTDEMSEANGTILSQNSPNPWNEETRISYSLPDGFSDASIRIYNLQGTQVKKFDLSSPSGEVVLQASELAAGIYIYSLVAGGQELSTKRMMLTD